MAKFIIINDDDSISVENSLNHNKVIPAKFIVMVYPDTDVQIEVIKHKGKVYKRDD